MTYMVRSMGKSLEIRDAYGSPPNPNIPL